MDANVIERKWIQGTTVKPDPLTGQTFTGESGAHTFRITGETTGGATAAITGTIFGQFLRSDNVTVALTGTLSSGVAAVTLTGECYAVPGRFIISIYSTEGGVDMCIYCGIGNVFRTSSDQIAYPSASLPDLEALTEQVQAAIASCPASHSAIQAAVAPNFVQGTANPAKTYVWNNGECYYLENGHTAGVAWADTTKTAAVIGTDIAGLRGEVADLKSALSNKYGDYQVLMNYGSANSSTGVITLNPNTKNRLVSNIEKKGLYKYIVCTNAEIRFMALYYASDLSFVKATDWISNTYELEDYPFVAILAKNGSAGTATFASTEIPVYLSQISSVPSIETLSDSVETLSDSVETDEALANNLLYDDVNYINRGATVASSSYATTKRWFLNLEIPSGSYIKSFNYYLPQKKIATALTVEVWTLINGTLTKVKSVTVSDFTDASENVVPIDYYCASPVMISFLSNTSVTYIANGGVHILSSSDTSTSTTTLAYSSLSDFGDFAPSVTVKTTKAKVNGTAVFPGNVVTVGPGMDFEEIQSALNAISDDSASNPYTILLMPRGTPYERFSTLRQFSETYPWSNISPRYISIIGVDKKHCVIKSNSGNYKLPCGEPMLNGMIKNITFIMTNSDQDPNATQGGYCLHIDCRTLDDVGYNMLIEDCDFEDASGPCLGIGMHKNCTLTIRRCNFHTTLAANYNPHEGYTNLVNYGVIFCHSSTRADATDQNIIIEDCVGLCEEGNKGLWLAVAGDYDPSTASFYYRLIRNVFWNTTQNAPSYSISSTLTADPMNYGNNIP